MNRKKIIFPALIFIILIVSFQASTKLYKEYQIKKLSAEIAAQALKDRQYHDAHHDNKPSSVNTRDVVTVPTLNTSEIPIKKPNPVETWDDNTKKNQPVSNNVTSKTGNSLKIAYLTFDDGPSPDITPQILDILKKNDIKATFFVIGKNLPDNKDLLLREKAEGHAIGNHTYAHDPDYLYKNPENLVSDFKKNEASIKEFIPDYNSKIVRFPGGSKNRPKQFRAAVINAGYKYFDWDCLTKDAEGVHVPVAQEDKNIKSTFRNQKKLIVLMHDSSEKDTTAEYLPTLINFLKTNGYTFNVLK